jgi:hypothetical protein
MRLAVSTRKGLLDFDSPTGAAGDWKLAKTSFRGSNVSTSFAVPGTDVRFASLSLGHFGAKLHRSTDGGATWTEIAVPVFPEGEIAYSFNQEKPAALKEIWSFASRELMGTTRIWAGTIPGGLFWSDDLGEIWTLCRSLWDDERRKGWFGGGKDEPGIHSICIRPQTPRTITLAISCGGVWRSEDDGESWSLLGKGLRAEYMPPEQQFDQNIQDAHLLAQCPGRPEGFWVQHHNGIFASTDGAENFRELTTVPVSAFGFAVAVHPNDPQTAWFVPAQKDEVRVPVDERLVVLKTTDGGETFRELRQGLPQENAWDIVYRHALAIDSTGERLVFGTTTGSLFATDDGGESWTLVATHLPPIHAVHLIEG